MTKTFNSDLLDAFVRVVDCGSFTQAARKLNATQPTISAKIARLETEAGHRLLKRSRRGVLSLTQQGLIVESLARETIRLHHVARRKLNEPEIGGLLRVGMSDDIASGLKFIKVIEAFAKSFPSVCIDTEIGNGALLLEKKNRGELDFVICKITQGSSHGATVLWKERLVWACGRDVAIDAAETIPLISFSLPCAYSEIARSRLQRCSIEWRQAFTCPSLSGVHAALRAGLGVALLPTSLVAPDFLQIDSRRLPDAGDVSFGYYRREEAKAEVFRYFEDLVQNGKP